jgi:hypothetical protein
MTVQRLSIFKFNEHGMALRRIEQAQRELECALRVSRTDARLARRFLAYHFGPLAGEASRLGRGEVRTGTFMTSVGYSGRGFPRMVC